MSPPPENGDERPLTKGARPATTTCTPTVASVPSGTTLAQDVVEGVCNMVDAATVGVAGPVGRLSWHLDGTQVLVAHFAVVDLAATAGQAGW